MNKALFGLCAICLISACSGPAIKDTALIQQAAENLAQSGDKNPLSVLEESRALQIQAQQADLYFYSPKHMEQAEQEMAKAEDAFSLGKPASEIITHSLTAKVLFERGLAIKPNVEQQLKPSFDGLAMLKEINTHVLLKGDFADIEDDIKDLVQLIESSKSEEAVKDQKDVLADINQLEIKTLKVAYFTPAENALEKAEEVDADDYAPKTFETAKKAVDKLDTFIESQYKNRQAVKDASKATIALAQHAENVAKAAKPLLKMNEEKAEQHILYVESLLDRVTKALKHDSITHMPLNNQSLTLAQGVETLNKQAQTNQNNTQWAKDKQKLEQTIAQLKKQLIEKPQPSADAEKQLMDTSTQVQATAIPAALEITPSQNPAPNAGPETTQSPTNGITTEATVPKMPQPQEPQTKTAESSVNETESPEAEQAVIETVENPESDAEAIASSAQTNGKEIEEASEQP